MKFNCMLPWVHPSPNPEWHLARFSRFCTDHGRVSLYLAAPSLLKITPSHMQSGPSSNMIPWAHPSPPPKQNLDRFSRLLQVTAECPYTLQWDAPSPSKLLIPMGRSGPPLWFPYMVSWANRSPQPKRHLYQFSRFCRADRQHHSAGNNRPHLRT